MEGSTVIRRFWKVAFLVSGTFNLVVAARAQTHLAVTAISAAKTFANYASSAAEFSSPDWVAYISKGQIPYHKVTLGDFKTITDPTAKYVSYTHTFTFFSYHFTIQRGDYVFARVDSTYVKSGIDRINSWKATNYSTFPQMLQHEQGHLDINEIFARKLALRLSQVSYVGEGRTDAEAVENLKQQMEAVYKKNAAERDAADLQYDRETQHGLDQAEQDDWTNNLAAQVKIAGITIVWIDPSVASSDQAVQARVS